MLSDYATKNQIQLTKHILCDVSNIMFLNNNKH